MAHTLLNPGAIERMLSSGAGAVTQIDELAARANARAGGPPRLFPWSPTMLTRAAIEAAGRPRGELFFGFDDWEYALRVARHDRVEWMDGLIARRRVGTTWPGRTYLSARNLAYLWRIGVRDPVLRVPLHGYLLRAAYPVHAHGRVIRRGLAAGFRTRVGPPPADLLPPV